MIELQVQNVTAKYTMKADDDTFVRLESVLEVIRDSKIVQGLYMGSMNEWHRPLRSGKWAVTVEVFFEIVYLFKARSIEVCSSKQWKFGFTILRISLHLYCVVDEFVASGHRNVLSFSRTSN